MFDKYGEFNSTEELRQAIQNQINEGDIQAAVEIGKENGIDIDDIRDIAYGTPVNEVITPAVAALGKIQVEAVEYNKLSDCIFSDWIEYIKAIALESPEAAEKIRSKDKHLSGCLAALLKVSFAGAFDVPDNIVKTAGVSAGKVKLGIPSQKKCKDIIRGYYS